MDALGDPVRRRLVELLGDGERTAGELAAAVGAERGISQPAVSRHLRVLREAGVVTARAEGPVRLYAVRAEALDAVGDWARDMTRYWRTGLDALATEVARGRRAARRGGHHDGARLDGARDDGGAGHDGAGHDGGRQDDHDGGGR
ncbi:ArsR/SmtB family transcription factor [Cellulomonas shaoxiangyii]|uniref:ArsR family transcriptional regulator n=1 Tax=Cellulomonas shaoxiangyii TaxID=2566013 RepID=A0A4P7SLV9_9CELL|nr:metalloregulator ArsR/SmtB family transcription factor [Cellulomonas shaoxiangyii]QCB95329.1 ArsR family transcriptional regulator [Cellulomonas shaoxiangyii]TGY83226.1 ArsR family transcriptional regulator [Cellulomonas shaoxiangyii]